MTTHRLTFYGPGDSLVVEVDDANASEQELLDRYGELMRSGDVIELELAQGRAQIRMADIWAVRYQPPAHVVR